MLSIGFFLPLNGIEKILVRTTSSVGDLHKDAQGTGMDKTTSPVSTGKQQDGLLTTTINVFAAPGEAFSSIRSRPRILFPLAVLLVPTLAVYFWYFQVVDYAWFIDDTIARFGDMPAEQQQAMRDYYGAQSPLVAGLTTVVGGLFSTLMILLVHAAYLTLVSALVGDDFRFRHWFSLLAWTTLPAVLVALVMAVNIMLIPSGQISIYDANSLSLASLGMTADTAAMQSLLDTLNLALFWSLALLVAGYRQWVNAGWLRSTLVVLAPYILIIGGVAFFALS